MTVPGGAPCPDCGAALELPYVCRACGGLFRAPPGLDAFARLGLPRRLDLDPELLESRYLDLSRRLHPDRMIGRPAAVQSRALVLSAALNEAYQALRDPARRAELLLDLHGGPGAEQDRSTPPGFLGEVLELREELEEAQARGDRERLEALLARVEPEAEATRARVRALLGAGEATPAAEARAGARLALNTLKYWTNLGQDIRRALSASPVR